MFAYIVRRLFHGVFVILGLAVVVFFVSHIVGDVARLMLPLEASEAQYLALRDELGLDDPLYVQFFNYVLDLARGDFGTSLWQNVPAMSLVLSHFPATVYLATATIAFAILVSIPLGIIAAVRPGSAVDRLTTAVSMIGISAPTFWVALIFVTIIAVNVDWLRTSGYGGPRYLLLPMIALSAPTIGRMVQVVRSAVLEEMTKPYLVTARSKGLTEQVIVFRHALRNALLPIVTLLGDEFAGLINGAVVIEVIFAWPGIGNLALQAIQRRDFPVIQSVVLFVALTVVLINLIVDILYVYIDPRIRYR